MPLVANYSLPVGEERPIPYSALKADGTAFDLTGYTLRFTMTWTPVGGAAPYLLQKTMTITNAAGGLATLSLVSADTSSLAAREYYFDIVAVNGSVQVPLTTGTFTLTDRVSR